MTTETAQTVLQVAAILAGDRWPQVRTAEDLETLLMPHADEVRAVVDGTRQCFVEMLAELRYRVRLPYLTSGERGTLEGMTTAQMRAELDAAGKLAPAGGGL